MISLVILSGAGNRTQIKIAKVNEWIMELLHKGKILFCYYIVQLIRHPWKLKLFLIGLNLITNDYYILPDIILCINDLPEPEPEPEPEPVPDYFVEMDIFYETGPNGRNISTGRLIEKTENLINSPNTQNVIRNTIETHRGNENTEPNWANNRDQINQNLANGVETEESPHEAKLRENITENMNRNRSLRASDTQVADMTVSVTELDRNLPLPPTDPDPWVNELLVEQDEREPYIRTRVTIQHSDVDQSPPANINPNKTPFKSSDILNKD